MIVKLCGKFGLMQREENEKMRKTEEMKWLKELRTAAVSTLKAQSRLESKAMPAAYCYGISATRMSFQVGSCSLGSWWELPIVHGLRDSWACWGGFVVHPSALWTCSVSPFGNSEPFNNWVFLLKSIFLHLKMY